MDSQEANIIAYLAPEIPALSATFVYNEIFGLENMGFQILPLSVHVPGTFAKGDRLDELTSRTHYLYGESSRHSIWANMRMILGSPLRYFKTLYTAVSDSIKIGMMTHIGKGLLYRFFKASRVAVILRRKHCSHIHVHFAHIPTDIAMYASGLTGIPFSFTSHANDLFERGWLLKEKVERARFAVTISEYNRQYLMERGAPEHKIHVVRCGVDSISFPLTIHDDPHQEISRIGTLGRMVEKKGFDTLIRACKILADKGFRFHVEIVGDGPQFVMLQEFVQTRDLSSSIIFCGPLPHNRVPGWLKGLDLFVLPCRKDSHGDMDGIPVVLMEAMLSGVPVISTRLSGIPELIEDGKTGLLIDPDDPTQLAEGIERLLSNHSLRKRLYANAVQKVRTEFDLHQNIHVLANLFKEAVHGPNQPKLYHHIAGPGRREVSARDYPEHHESDYIAY